MSTTSGGDGGDGRPTPPKTANGAVNGASRHHDEHGEDDEESGPSLDHAFDPPPRGPVEPAPEQVADLAAACVRFVQRALGVELDYAVETLPLLDHWLADARRIAEEGKASGKEPDAAVDVVASSAGAYLGEVIRRRHASWWRLEGGPEAWRIELTHAWVSLRPVELVVAALTLRGGDALDVGFELDDDDRPAVAARLAELPEVEVEELVAPSTRVEVLDIVVDTIRARQLAAGIAQLELEPDDYTDE